MMKNIFSFLFPKEVDFFAPMSRMFELIGKSVEAYLIAAAKEKMSEDDKEALLTALKQNELDGDEIVRKTKADLKKTFTPPFSQMELRRLFGKLDNALDMLDESAKVSIHADYRAAFPPFVLEQLQIFQKGLTEAFKLTDLMRNPRENADEINRVLKRLSDIETEGDKIYWPKKKELSAEINKSAEQNQLTNYRKAVMDELTLDQMERIIDTLVDILKVIEGMTIEHA